MSLVPVSGVGKRHAGDNIKHLKPISAVSLFQTAGTGRRVQISQKCLDVILFNCTNIVF